MSETDFFLCIIQVNTYTGDEDCSKDRLLMFIHGDQLEQYQKDGGIYNFYRPDINKRWICTLDEIRTVPGLTDEMIYNLQQSVNHTDLHISLIYHIEEKLGNIPS